MPENNMQWNHEAVFNALVEGGHPASPTDYASPYVCLRIIEEQEGHLHHAMILYSAAADAQYANQPITINNAHDAFCEELFNLLQPALVLEGVWQENNHGQEWDHYAVNDWDQLANGLGLNR